MNFLGCTALILLVATARSVSAQQPAPSPEAPRTAAAKAEAPQKVVEEGLFPKSWKVPGTDLSIAIGGYIKVDFIQDIDAIGDAFEFKVNSIPMAGSAAAAQSGRTTIHARETRLNLDVRSEGSGGRHFRAFVEGDFFGDGNAFRMRHAFGEFGAILGGQTWSTFQDITARPLTVDFEGSDGEVFVRQAMIRLTRRFNANWSAAVAVENPTPQFAVPAGLAGSPRAQMPDIPGFVRYQRGSGHVQVAGLLRQLRFDSTGAEADTSTTGWGVNGTFALPVGPRDQVLGQFVIGEGTARYIEGLSGQNFDAILTPEGDLTALRTQGANVGYIHHWRADLKSGVAFSTSFVEDDDRLSPAAIDRLSDVRANLFWTPYRQVDFAAEVLWGQRRNKDGSTGEAVRIQFATIFRLN